jgi:hypothetical protein
MKLLLSRAVLAAVALGALACGSAPPTTTQSSARSTGASRAESTDEASGSEASSLDPHYDASNHWLVQERYCQPIAAMSSRVLDSCGCSNEDRGSSFLSDEELAASCNYHLVVALPDDRPMAIDEPALARCMAELDAALVGCTETRLPEACELARIFTPWPLPLSYARPAGEVCRAENGDESFDAHFLCAEGLRCASTCTAGLPTPAAERCHNPLGLPPAIP